VIPEHDCTVEVYSKLSPRFGVVYQLFMVSQNKGNPSRDAARVRVRGGGSKIYVCLTNLRHYINKTYVESVGLLFVTSAVSLFSFSLRFASPYTVFLGVTFFL